ncbi:hypothetical protein L1987_42611 [Smallanthus sonchifolius]|uniref:Uncharacterized protein n=1 Tax=Smallanthus sonchifolius TaxID=185202 RepID=A0ACB9GJF2_9ASTR|nr:hypothetical protein L1987_42611 [Smallanthus sonchifolius]
MVRSKGTTLQFKMKQEGAITNNGGGESSFRVLYYGDASAGSVPFMWESRPGTPKQPPPTPPPSSHQFNQDYNSSKHSTSLRTLFLFTGSRKTHLTAAPPSSTSESNISYTSLHSLFLASSSRRAHEALPHSLTTTPMSKGQGKREFRRSRAAVKGMEEDGSSTATLCFGGGFMKVYAMKKVKSALMSIGSYGKMHNN